MLRVWLCCADLRRFVECCVCGALYMCETVLCFVCVSECGCVVGHVWYCVSEFVICICAYFGWCCMFVVLAGLLHYCSVCALYCVYVSPNVELQWRAMVLVCDVCVSCGYMTVCALYYVCVCGFSVCVYGGLIVCTYVCVCAQCGVSVALRE